MYVPPSFDESRPEVLHAFIRQHSFGLLVSHLDGELTASHLPFLFLEEDGTSGTLLGHMARANPQWRGFREDEQVLVIFQGPHAYISPSWYEARLSVPTWNYAVVHAYGNPRTIEDPTALRAILDATVAEYESGFDRPWDPQLLPREYIEKMSQQIVGFEIRLTRLHGKFKLSQNRSATDRRGVVDGLRQSGRPLDHQVADLMDDFLDPSD